MESMTRCYYRSKKVVGGPGGLGCSCCAPMSGSGKAKRESRRMVRRVEKARLRKTLGRESE